MPRGAASSQADVAAREQFERKAHAEARDLGRDVREAALVLARAQVDMNPGDRSGTNFDQEARGENVIAVRSAAHCLMSATSLRSASSKSSSIGNGQTRSPLSPAVQQRIMSLQPGC
jgi:hypothetical protein